MGDLFVYIRYLQLEMKMEVYRYPEVSQNIKPIQEIKGEKGY